MCGRFIVSKPKDIKKRFKTKNKLPLFDASYNITPSQMVPAITRNSPNTITMMRWGLVWNKVAKQGVINIRKETTKQKPYFKNILLNQRCIIPSDGFYEWKSAKLEGKQEKYPFFIYLKDRSLFGFAGIYNKLIDAEGRPHYTLAILTCPPNSLVGKVHHRMPVILKEKEEDRWLDPDNNNFELLYNTLTSFPSSKMGFHPISKRVNNPSNDDKDLIKVFEENKLF